MESGDVHVAVYDFGQRRALLSTGTTDPTGANFTRKACDAPFLSFDMDGLWAQQPPKAKSAIGHP